MKCLQSVKKGRGNAAFTIVEVVISLGLVVVLVGMLVGLSEGTGRTIVSITNQTTENQAVGNGIEFIMARIRLANTASNDATGNVLTLSFDDNPYVDSNGDGLTWNDKDHYEQFIYKTTDTNWSTLDDNYICYKANVNTASTNIIVPSSVRKLSSTTVFAVSNTTVWINFGLLTTNSTPLSQAIEIRTKVTMRNKTS